MPRMRTIKPGFFTNEDLVELDPLACLLFAGLWCWADREGRLEDRPRRLRMEILPGRDCDVDDLLDQLAGYGFVERYVVEGQRLIQVVAFRKHQNPHRNERPSILPAPPSCVAREKDEHAREKDRPPPEKVVAARAGHGGWGVGNGSWGAGHGVPPPAQEERVGGMGGVRGGRAARAAESTGPPAETRGDDADTGTARRAPDLPRAEPADLTQPRPRPTSPAWTEPMRRIAARVDPEAAGGAFDAGREETR